MNLSASEGGRREVPLARDFQPLALSENEGIPYRKTGTFLDTMTDHDSVLAATHHSLIVVSLKVNFQAAPSAVPTFGEARAWPSW